MGHLLSVPLVWVIPKSKDDNKIYDLPDFAKPAINEEEEEADEINKTNLVENDIKNDIIDQTDVQKKQSDQIDWLHLDEVEFLPSESNLYQQNKNVDENINEKVENDKLKEKLILSMLTGHLHRYCEEKLKCSVDDLIYEFHNSNTNSELNEQIGKQDQIISFKAKKDSNESDHT